jgi:RES domain-containing protein
VKVYRIVKDKARTTDLSGTGAFRVGGRWNSKGTYMLYTSENSSLAFLEALVHFDKSECPPRLHVMHIEVAESASIYAVPDVEYPKNWLELELLENKKLGDKWMGDKAYLGIRVRSSINILEYNILLNPLFPNYPNLVKVIDMAEVPLDER